MNMTNPSPLAFIAALAPAISLCAPTAAQQFGTPERLVEPAFDLNFISCVAIDVDDDGDLDVVSTASKSAGLTWIEQLGINSRDFRVTAPIGTLPNALRVLMSDDLDGDGRADLLVVQPQSAAAYVHWNEGGSFSPAAPLNTGPRLPYEAAFADVDGDGDPDVVLPVTGTTSLPERLTWIENLGARQFAARAPFPGIDADPTQVLTGDVDGDGSDDVVIYSSDNRVLFYRRTASGFAPSQQIFGLQASAFVQLHGLADVDLDGDLELHLTSQSSQGPLIDFVVPFDGSSATFGTATAVPGTPGRGLLLDITGDGIPDIASRQATGPQTFVRGLGGMQFGSTESLEPVSGLMERFLLGADLDGDGAQDLLSFGDGGFAWRAGEPAASGPALEPNSRSILALLRNGNAAAAIDLDADGALDLAVASGTEGLLKIGSNGFGSVGALRPLVATESPVMAESVRRLDVDGDGLPDLALRLENRDYQWRRALPNGSFEPAVTIQTLFAASQEPEFADMDGDGDLDLIERTPTSAMVRWWQQGPAGTFSSAAPLLTLQLNADLSCAGDVDGDGILDLVVAVRFNFTRTRVRWFRGLGGGQFDPGTTLATLQTTLSRLNTHDLSGDGRDEIYWGVGEQGPRTLTSLDPVTGTFAPPTAFPFWEVSEVLHAEDLDADGVTDLLLVNAPAARVRFRRGLGGMNFGSAEAVAVPEGFYRSSETVDMDSDGDLDLVLTLGTGLSPIDSPSSIFLIRNRLVDTPGGAFCGPAQLNSRGKSATISGSGSPLAAENSLSLRTMDLPSGATTLFLTSRTTGFVSHPGGSAGDLCLGGSIGRFVGPGQLQTASVNGTTELGLDLTALPQMNSSAPALAGETWHFQAWYRDSVAGIATSNFTDGMSLTLQ